MKAIPIQIVFQIIYNKEIKGGNKIFKYDAFIHFYVDDQFFDGKESSIWLYPYKALDIISHFSGIIAPDFSTYADFPEPLKRYNYYRISAFGFWISNQGIPVISNCRWGTEETWSYCFDGNPKNGIICIGSVASGINLLSNRPLFENGLYKMVEVLSPKAIIVYGSSKYRCFDLLRRQGIVIVEYQSETNLAFARRNK